MTAECNSYTGTATQTPNPAKPRRLNLDTIRERASAATKGPWGLEDDGPGLMVLNRGTCQPVAFVGPAEDEQAQADGQFLAAAREDVPALLAEIDAAARELRETQENLDRARARLHDALAEKQAANEVANDATNRAGVLTAELNAARTEVERLRRLLDSHPRT